MFFSGFPEFNIDDLTGVDNNSYCGDGFGFDQDNWYPSNVAGPSQPYTGAGVWGDLDNYPDFPTPSTAPISLSPTHGVSLNEGYHSPFYQGVALPSSPQQATTPSPLLIHSSFPTPSPVPILPHGSPSLSPESYAVPIPPTYNPHTQPRIIPNLDLGFGLPTVAENLSLLTVHPSLAYDPSYKESRRQWPQPDPFHFDLPPFDPIKGAIPPEIPHPPVDPPSGPQRTKKSAREGRRYDPVKLAGRKANSDKDGWDRTLIRFRAKFDVEFDTLYSVHNGQPSGGLVPETALANIDQFVKEDLKRSPLQNRAPGEEKRSRSGEDYLKGLLQAIRRVDPTPIPAGGGSNENDTSAAALLKIADGLEAKLAVVNQRPALRRSKNVSGPGQNTGGKRTQKSAKKNESERVRRSEERHHIGRVSRLFRAPQHPWSRNDVLSLAVLFLLYGPGAFPHDFLEVRPIAPGL